MFVESLNRAGWKVTEISQVDKNGQREDKLSYQQLDLAITDVLSSIKPSDANIAIRHDIVRIARKFFPSLKGFEDAKVEPYGSFVYNIYTEDADVDISVDIPNSLISDAGVLEKLWRALQDINQKGLGMVPGRIPHLTIYIKRGDFTCDITVNNHLGKIRSKFLLWISKIDKRFCDLVLLVKAWARVHDINNPKDGTFNSYALCLLVIFHLQTCEPAILPALKDICCLGDHYILRQSDETRIEDICDANIDKFISTRTVNRSTLSHLLFSFFEKFCDLDEMSATKVISTYNGKWEDRNSRRTMAQTTQNTALHIEDPIELSDNAGRSVRKQQLKRITDEFIETHNSLFVPCSWIPATVRCHYTELLMGRDHD